jgi:hypothetical protein
MFSDFKNKQKINEQLYKDIDRTTRENTNLKEEINLCRKLPDDFVTNEMSNDINVIKK